MLYSPCITSFRKSISPETPPALPSTTTSFLLFHASFPERQCVVIRPQLAVKTLVSIQPDTVASANRVLLVADWWRCGGSAPPMLRPSAHGRFSQTGRKRFRNGREAGKRRSQS
ncbi:unnamed protein product [Strongylus vulgaris]|uniref:Uncharacterized protein n=1 Tax=Strongylus vulgaris TaxID=40348 RepID=A0A3P7JYD5_STRVU|nr:unnamed protein product [Strongylus vulgaris]